MNAVKPVKNELAARTPMSKVHSSMSYRRSSAFIGGQ